MGEREYDKGAGKDAFNADVAKNSLYIAVFDFANHYIQTKYADEIGLLLFKFGF